MKDYKPEGSTPTTDPALYHLSFPTAEGNLALRQTALGEWTPKFARLKSDFEAEIEKRNKAFNSSGCPYKADGRKRAADGTGQEEEGEPFPEGNVVESLEALGQEHGALPRNLSSIEKAKKRKALFFTWSMDISEYEASWGQFCHITQQAVWRQEKKSILCLLYCKSFLCMFLLHVPKPFSAFSFTQVPSLAEPSPVHSAHCLLLLSWPLS